MTEDSQSHARRLIDPRTALVVYVRVLAIVFLASGIRRWAVLLGPLAPDGDVFTMPTELVVAVGFFAVAELVAAVGLWLLASWGTVVWLIVALTESLMHSVFSETYGQSIPLVASHGLSVSIYAGLTLWYERSRDN